jgi:hypothetical protein
MVHGHPVKYRAKNLAGACHGFLRKFLELIVHGTAVLTVRIHLPPAVSLRTIGSSRHRYRAWPRDRSGRAWESAGLLGYPVILTKPAVTFQSCADISLGDVSGESANCLSPEHGPSTPS